MTVTTRSMTQASRLGRARQVKVSRPTKRTRTIRRRDDSLPQSMLRSLATGQEFFQQVADIPGLEYTPGSTTELLPLPDGTMGIQELTAIDRVSTTTGGQNTNRRTRDIIRAQAIKINAHFNNRADRVVFLRMAVISIKHGLDDVQTDFFDNQNGASRAQDFDPTMRSIELRNTPINRDKFNIHWEGTYDLGPDDADAAPYNLNGGKSWVTVKKYLPLSKYIRYEKEDGASCMNKHYLVFWCVQAGVDPASRNGVTASLRPKKCYFEYHNMLAFRNVN